MGQSFLTTPHTRRRPKARPTVACLVLAAGLALFAGTAQARYQPGESPGINPGEPTFTGATNPVPAEPVAQRRVARPPEPTDSRPQRAEAPGTRPHWFACACCPPNIMRTIASLGGYVATYNDSGIQVQQYIPSTVDTPVGSLSTTTRYPLDGAVEVAVTATSSASAWWS